MSRQLAALLVLFVLGVPTARADAAAQHAACVQALDYLTARETIRFEAASSRLPGLHDALIDEIAALMVRCPGSVLTIEGHTDNRGDADDNLALSTARARAVGDALIARGIAATRIRVQGFGGTRPIADNGSRDGRRANRRITLRFDRTD